MVSDASDYNLDLGRETRRGHDPYANVDLDYQPTGTLELDTRPLTSGRVRELRHQSRRPPHRRKFIPYLSLEEFADRLGCPVSTAKLWEDWKGDELGPTLSAIIRMHFATEASFEWEDCPVDWVRAIAWAVGGYDALAEETGRAPQTTRHWAQGSGASSYGGAGPLLRYLFEDLGLEPLEEWPMPPNATLTPREVREICQLYESTGLGYGRVGKRLGYSKSQVRRAVNDYQDLKELRQ